MTCAAYLMRNKLMTHTDVNRDWYNAFVNYTFKCLKGHHRNRFLWAIKKDRAVSLRELKRNLLRLISSTTTICELSKPIALNSRMQNHAETQRPETCCMFHQPTIGLCCITQQKTDRFTTNACQIKYGPAAQSQWRPLRYVYEIDFRKRAEECVCL